MSGVRAKRGRVAALARFRDADDPELAEARRDFWSESLAEHVQKLVDQAPPLTFEQIGRITSILANAARAEGE